MAAPALEIPKTKEAAISDGTLKIILTGVLLYWGFIALTHPVTNHDSQVYNLARLLVAEQAGFWQTTSWTAGGQIIFPWTFDAVHYAFLKLGFGFGLPSFAALLGILATAYNLISPRWGRYTALWACLTITAMPTIVLQATSTKNDLVVVFALGCWFYAWERYDKIGRRIYLFLAALSLTFAAGSKTSAIPACLICTLMTLWLLRRDWSSILFFVGTYIPLLILFGSIETYVLCYSRYHNLLGPAGVIRGYTNRDGARGAVATLIRYFFGNLSFGIDGNTQESGLSLVLEKKCRHLLGLLRFRDIGYVRGLNDTGMRFLKGGMAAAADFGLPGALSMVSTPFLLLRFRSAPVVALTAAAGVVSLIILSWGIAWTPWNARFLCLPFVLFGIAFCLVVFSDPNRIRIFQVVIGFLTIWSAVSFPFLAFNEKPSDLSAVFRDREHLQFSEKADLRTLYDRVLQIKSSAPGIPWFLVPGQERWTLPFLAVRNFGWRLAPRWSGIAEWEKSNPDKPAYILALQDSYQNELAADIVDQYPGYGVILKIPAK